MKTQRTLVRRLDYLAQNGASAREPASKPLRDGIFELKAKFARCLYYFGENQTVVFVHAIHKKRGDVPKRDIDLALFRQDEIESGREGLNELA